MKISVRRGSFHLCVLFGASGSVVREWAQPALSHLNLPNKYKFKNTENINIFIQLNLKKCILFPFCFFYKFRLCWKVKVEKDSVRRQALARELLIALYPFLSFGKIESVKEPKAQKKAGKRDKVFVDFECGLLSFCRPLKSEFTVQSPGALC